MDRLAAMTLLVAIADEGSFTAAADSLNLSRTAASKQIKALEAQLGVRLLHRTTRRISLTEAGEGYIERARDILERLDEAEQLASTLQAEPQGVLRLNAPTNFGQHQLAPAFTDFLARHPKLKVEMTLNDRRVDLVEEGYDMAVRIGQMADSSYMARKIAETDLALVASPGYIKAHGAPEQPADLAQHACLPYAYFATGNRWRFTQGERLEEVRIDGPMTTNSGDAIREAAVADLGIGLLPAFQVAEDIRAARLWRLLPRWTGDRMGIYAVYPPSRLVPAKTRLFIDYLVARFADPGWLRDRPAPRGGPGKSSMPK